MGDEQRDLQRRWTSVVDGTTPAADAFADWTPAWHGSTYHSADVQIAAASSDAVARGDFLVVLGDFHGGDNPLAQGLFGLRHPDPVEIMRRIATEIGPGIHLSPPRRGVVEMTARSWPMYPEGDVVMTSGDSRRLPARAASRSMTSSPPTVTSRTAQAPSASRSRTFSSSRSSSPRCAASTRSETERNARRSGAWSRGARAGRRRQACCRRSPTSSPPGHATAASRGTSSPARRSSASPDTWTSRARPCAASSFASSPDAREQVPDRPVEFTEMLPGPDECWLQSDAGHHTSELRVVALDRTNE